jgi:hypothetical protein
MIGLQAKWAFPPTWRVESTRVHVRARLQLTCSAGAYQIFETEPGGAAAPLGSAGQKKMEDGPLVFRRGLRARFSHFARRVALSRGCLHRAPLSLPASLSAENVSTRDFFLEYPFGPMGPRALVLILCGHATMVVGDVALDDSTCGLLTNQTSCTRDPFCGWCATGRCMPGA